MGQWKDAELEEELQDMEQRLKGLDPDRTGFTTELVAAYLEFTGDRIQALRPLAETKLWTVMHEELHDLKSTSLNLGSKRMGEHFHQLEIFARGANQADFFREYADVVENYRGLAIGMRSRFLPR